MRYGCCPYTQLPAVLEGEWVALLQFLTTNLPGMRGPTSSYAITSTALMDY